MVLLIMFFNANTVAQPTWRQRRNELFKQLAQAKDDTMRANWLTNIGVDYEANNPDSAMYYYNEAKKLCDKTSFVRGKIRYLACMTELLETQARFQEALQLCLQAITLAKKANRQHMLAGAYNNTAQIYDDLGSREKALEYYQYAVNIYERLKSRADSANLATVCGNMLSLYVTLEQKDKAYAFGIKTLALSRATQNNDAMLIAYANLSSLLIDMNRPDTALILAKQQYQLSKQINDKILELNALGNINSILLSQNKLAKVKQHADEMRTLATDAKDVGGLANADYYTAAYYFNLKNFKAAKSYALRALKIIRDNHINTIDIHFLMADISLATGDLTTYKREKIKGDSLRENTISGKILKYNQEMETKYALSKKQAEINTLHDEKTIQKLTLDKQKIITVVLGFAVFIALLLGGLYIRFSSQKNKLLQAQAELKQQRITELEQLQQLISTETMLRSQEEERKRIAKELHDGLGGILSGAKFSLSSMKQNFIVTEENMRSFEKTMDMLDHSIAELRRVAHNMMPETLLKLTFDEALLDYCQQISNNSNLQITYQSFGMQDTAFDDTVKITVYRITQELINNIVKHAQAKTAMVQLIAKNEELNITVEDDGIGFDVESLPFGTGIGYKSLRGRVDFLRGRINIESVKDRGTHVYIEIPV